MSTDEQDQEIGRAHRRRKEAQQELRSLHLKARRLGEALNPVLSFLLYENRKPEDVTAAQIAAYPEAEEVRRLIQDMQTTLDEISRLDELLA